MIQILPTIELIIKTVRITVSIFNSIDPKYIVIIKNTLTKNKLPYIKKGKKDEHI